MDDLVFMKIRQEKPSDYDEVNQNEATRESCSPEPNSEKICEVFSEVYYMVLKVIPLVLALDDQAVGRV